WRSLIKSCSGPFRGRICVVIWQIQSRTPPGVLYVEQLSWANIEPLAGLGRLGLCYYTDLPPTGAGGDNNHRVLSGCHKQGQSRIVFASSITCRRFPLNTKAATCRRTPKLQLN